MSESARILGMFPVPGKSHMIVFSALTKALAERGHELVVVSTFPMKNPPANYTDINIWESLKEIYEQTVDTNLYDFADMPFAFLPLLYWYEGVHIVDLVFKNNQVKSLLNDERGFDLVIAEDFMSDAVFGFAHHFKVCVLIKYIKNCMSFLTIYFHSRPP
jgi:glucuronosyltransferase